MRRKIAMLLALIMIVGVIPPVDVFGAVMSGKAASQYGFTAREYGISFGTDSPTPDTDKAPGLLGDQGGAQWNISNSSGGYNDGLYRFTYYVFNKETYRIEVDLEVGKDKDGHINPSLATVGVSTYKENETVANSVNYTQLNVKVPTTTTSTRFVTELKLDQMAEDRELELKIGNYSVLKFQIKQGVVQLTTTGITKGYITPYTLQFADSWNPADLQQDAKIDLFKGIEGLKVLPKHLYTEGGVLKSKDILTTQDDVPGSKPGIKVEFTLPKMIENGKFTSVSQGGQEYITLNLREEFATTGGGQPTMPKQVSFKLVDKAPIYDGYELGNPGSKIGNITIAQDMVSLYVVNERTDIEEPVAGELVEWEEMKSGMLMQTLLTLKGGRFEDLA
ncbi:MAG: hypothetical protein ACRCTE_13685, partial [Cellulosilyticaceae bacterium]